MDQIPNNVILKFNPNTLDEVRKEAGLDKNRLKEGIDILEDWVQKQAHFNKKDFGRDYFERSLITAKGSVEKAKQRIDKMCTMKTLMPEFFVFCDPREDFREIDNVILQANLPRMTSENYRVHVIKFCTDNFTSSDLFKYYLKAIMHSEYMTRYEYCSGFQAIADIRELNLLNAITKVNPVELRNLMTIMSAGYGLRIKGIHLLTGSKMVDALVTFLKQVLTPKVVSRVFVHRNLDSLYQHVPKEILPVDFGGTEGSLKELCAKWLDILDSEDNKKHYKEMLQANTDETRRPAENFNQEHIGTPGSFRTLTLD